MWHEKYLNDVHDLGDQVMLSDKERRELRDLLYQPPIMKAMTWVMARVVVESRERAREILKHPEDALRHNYKVGYISGLNEAIAQLVQLAAAKEEGEFDVLDV